MKIVVDRVKCTGLGMCEVEAPELFEVLDDASLAVLDEAPGEDRRGALLAAVQACPTGAISITEDD